MSNKDDLANQLDSYEMGPEAQDLVNSSKILLIVGAAGAGKNTIIEKLIQTGKFHFLISHTTREPRTNHGVLEQHGREFYFIDWDEAKRMIDNKEFIEAKIIHRRDLYGTSVQELQKAKDESKIATTDIDVQGVEEYKKISPNVVAVFVLPPDFETWQERLLARYKNHEGHEAEILWRLETAEAEFERALEDNYFQFIINDDLDATVKEIQEIATTGASKNQAEGQKLLEDLLRKTQEYLKKNK